METKAIFLDVDGTLVSFDTHRVPQSAIEAMQQVNENGIKIKIEKGEKVEETSICERMKIGNKTYKIIGEYTKIKDKEHKNSKEYMSTIYFLDETNYVDLLQKYNDIQACV